MHQIVICDLDLLREMFSRDVFSARGKPKVFGINLYALLKGGDGGHGLMFNEGILYIIVGQNQFYYKHVCLFKPEEAVMVNRIFE